MIGVADRHLFRHTVVWSTGPFPVVTEVDPVLPPREVARIGSVLAVGCAVSAVVTPVLLWLVWLALSRVFGI